MEGDDDGSAVAVMKREDNCIDLPPGFRFHPTDEEIITHYLLEKVLNSSFTATALGEVDLNKCEPWDLPRKAKMGEKEWYFFCLRDRKYPSGMRTNRATEAGYWKATGKDREIFKGKDCLVGMKKTLVFYRGRAPKGEKTNWVMNEYRLDGNLSRRALPNTAKEAWVVCKVFHKRTQVLDNNSSSSSDALPYLPKMNSLDDNEDDHGQLDSNYNINYYGAHNSIIISSNLMRRREEDEEVVYKSRVMRRAALGACDDNINIHRDLDDNYLQLEANPYHYHNVATPNSSTLTPRHQFDGSSSDFGGCLPRHPISSTTTTTSDYLAASSSPNNQPLIFDHKNHLPFISSSSISAGHHHPSSVSEETTADAWGAAAAAGMEPPSSSGPVVDLEFLWNC